MTQDDWKRIQRRLAKLGFNPGPLDGIRGRNTVSAIKRFQESKGLVADGIVGPITQAALFGEATAAATPAFDTRPWFDHALQLIGLAEDPRRDVSNPAVIDLGEVIDIDYKDDDIPWCGLFVGHCIASALGDEPLPVNPLAARNWSRFGEECEPQVGAVLVFWRHRRAGWQGHVGFYHGEDRDHFHVLGGNQGNAVNVVKIPRKRLIEARWPITAAAPTGETVVGADEVMVSSGEQ
jgi:uncharacterized protein (TIGR02594 family)